jgi:hypothetical protein
LRLIGSGATLFAVFRRALRIFGALGGGASTLAMGSQVYTTHSANQSATRQI